ncbi:PorP/SprF family type IX secretion system membrane protein [Echinicola vietnamensis]|uniref:Bacteroidetes-specific putative membrane protein n=1 Tax=Echinicola vietnamensis (strain DSM 17526 / LMG 23754 / KMM 6221) TaxID=926556 RepID=L0FYQ5_ECHVK|nr:type IX secretion system membrane protein PorP/SprF [Echinicola vietnamensis]AGA78173.1 Bacteroidetes-specific putative membrane protein [Echinicola vietnamensis DSM 17526]
MMKKLTIVWLLMITALGSTKAQDFQYSQFYAAPLYLNPAMAGATELTRVGANYRKQWPGLSNDFTAYAAYIDHYSYDLNSGFGLAVNSFRESNMNINTSDISLFYSYNLQLADTWHLRFGGQAAIVRRSAVLDNLVFGDQIDVFSQTIAPNTLDQIPAFDPYSYLDISFGTLVNNDFFFLGIAGHHVNQPRLSFFPDNSQNTLPLKVGIHGGYNIPLGSNYQWGSPFDNQVTLLASYKQQGPFKQLDIGTQLLYGKVIGGLSYRGIPSTQYSPNHDAIIALLGIKLDAGFVIGYSYDYQLSPIGSQTKGAHEVSFRYLFLWGNPKDRNRKSRINDCFYYMM